MPIISSLKIKLALNRCSCFFHLENSTMMQVILSVPVPSQSGEWISLAMISSNISSTTREWRSLFFLEATFFCITSTHYWLVRQSQIPSQAMIKNSSLSSLLYLEISGTQVIICSSSTSFLFVLYSRSPSARERLNMPFTLPSSTNPPAFLIRASSPVLSGLWSSLSSIAFLFLDKTARESPAFAQ